jgi:hypothetical protein
MSTKREQLLQASAAKVGSVMFAIVKLKDPADPEDTIYQMVKDTFTYDELIAVVCDSAANHLINVVNENPEMAAIIGAMKEMQNKEEDKQE